MLRHEHERLEGFDSPDEVLKEGMRLPNASGQDRWFFRWQWRGYFAEEDTATPPGYYATYVIGAQWIEGAERQPLVITPKKGCQRIDFVSLFARCFFSGDRAADFSQIYAIDMEAERIPAPELQSVLSPLIVVHFLSMMQTLLKGGLKRDYIPREENLKHLKGHIAISRHERLNVLRRRADRVYCRYQEYTEDIPENRLLKKALLFAEALMQTFPESESRRALELSLRQSLAAFASVSDGIEVWELKQVKTQKLFPAYAEALRLAQVILRRCDYSLARVSTQEPCPVFWVDMALLYEHYVLSLLREAYGDQIRYQAKGHTGRPDFLCHTPEVIMDAKYIPVLREGKLKKEIVRQLAGYARDRRLFAERPEASIPCLVIYPEEGAEENPFALRPLASFLEQEDIHHWGFHRVAVPLPTLSSAGEPQDSPTNDLYNEVRGGGG